MHLRLSLLLVWWAWFSTIVPCVLGDTVQVDDTQSEITYNPPSAWSSTLNDAKKGDGCIHPNGSHFMSGSEGGRASLVFSGTEISLWGSFVDTTPPLLNITLTGGLNGTLIDQTTVTPNVANVNACGTVYSKTALPMAEYTIAVFVPAGPSASDFRLDGFRYVAQAESHALSQGILIVAIVCGIVGGILVIGVAIWLIIKYGKKRRVADDGDSLDRFRREISGKERGGEARRGVSGVTTSAWAEGYSGGPGAGRFGRGVPPSNTASVAGSDTDAAVLSNASAYEKLAPRGFQLRETFMPRGHRRGSSSSPLVSDYDVGPYGSQSSQLGTGRPPSIGIWSFRRPTRTPSPPIAPPETPPDAPPLPNIKHYTNPHGAVPAFPGGVLSPPRRSSAIVPSPGPRERLVPNPGARVSQTLQRAQGILSRPKLSPLGEVDDPITRTSVASDATLAATDQQHSTLNLRRDPSSSRPGPGLSRVPPPPAISPQASAFGLGPQPTSDPQSKPHRERDRTAPRLGSTARAFPPSPTNSDKSKLGPPKRLSQLEPLGPIPLAPPAQSLWGHLSKGKGKGKQRADQPGVSATGDPGVSGQRDSVLPEQSQNIVVLPARDSVASGGSQGMVNMNRKRQSQMSEAGNGLPLDGQPPAGVGMVRIPRLSASGVGRGGGHRESSITAVGAGSPFGVVRETSSAIAEVLPPNSSPRRSLPPPPHQPPPLFVDGRERSYGEDDNPTPPPDGVARSRMSHMHGLPVPGNLMGFPRPGSTTSNGNESLAPPPPIVEPAMGVNRRLVGPHAHLPPEDTRSWISPDPSLMRFGTGFRESTAVDDSVAGAG